MTWGQALAWRLRRHLLDPVGTFSVRDVVGRLGAVPAYPETTPEFAVGIRRTGSRFGDVASALDAGEVFKTFAFRGATHLLTPEEGGAYLALRASGHQWELPSWQETYGLAPGDWPAFREAVREAVAEGPLTREELAVAVARLRPFRAAAAGLATSFALLKALMWQGDLCFGPAREGEGAVQGMHKSSGGPGCRISTTRAVGPRGIHPHLRPHEHRRGAVLPGGRFERRSQGAPRLARRSLGPPRKRRIDGEDLLLFADDVDDLTSTVTSPTVCLVPAADPWVMGPGTANPQVVPPAHRQPVTRGANLVLADGVVAGTWARKKGTLSVAWLEDTDPPDLNLLEQDAARLAAILDTELDLNVTSG